MCLLASVCLTVYVCDCLSLSLTLFLFVPVGGGGGGGGRERERNSISKTSFHKDCSLGSGKACLTTSPG